MTLGEYIKNLQTDDFLELEKFVNLFRSLDNGGNVRYHNGGSIRTKEEILELISNFNNDEQSFVLMCNPDMDIPCITDYWFNRDELTYNEEYQKEIDKKPIESFLQMDLLENIPENVTIYCHSVIKRHTSLNMIPLGRDHKGFYTNMKNVSKEILCYLNFSVPPEKILWYGLIRKYIYEDSSSKKFIYSENVENVENRNCDFVNYYEKLSKSKFMISPRGCGLDTYRLWDSLYLGTIPIVVKYEGYENFDDLPILFLDKWEDYLDLDEKKLENIWNEYIERDFNYDKMKFSYWDAKINNHIKSSK